MLAILVASFLFLTTGVSAGFENNLAYRSPIHQRPELGVNIPRLRRRFLRKRQTGAQGLSTQTLAPQGISNNYPAYGDAGVDWSESLTDFIYAGRLNFSHGVASGDPYDTSVILWTRAFPLNAATRDVPTCLTYEVRDSNFTGNVVTAGFAYSSYDVDNTVKVEATGLQPETTYYYQFSNCANSSEKSWIGRTRTAPGESATNVGTQRFAVYSCSNWPVGFFNSYGGPIAHGDEVDYVLHLGDYIYESGSNTTGQAIGRIPQPTKAIFSITDYRRRYANYREDPDLLASHQRFPWINIWDDHEVANNGAGICFTEREANAKRAYHEWIPIRTVDVTDSKRIYRSLSFGDLLDVVALDTRYYDRDVSSNGYNNDYVATLAPILNSTRSMTGPKQEAWYFSEIDKSQARGTKWRMVMNQVLFGTFNQQFTVPGGGGDLVDFDKWDGYQAQRQRILQRAYDNDWTNTFLVTGDSHENWLFENNLDTVLRGSLNDSSLKQVRLEDGGSYKRGQLVEFGGPGVSSDGYGVAFGTYENATTQAGYYLVRRSPSALWTEGFYHGYMTVVISQDNVTTSYWAYTDNSVRNQNRTLSGRFTVQSGTNSIQRPLNVTFGSLKP